MLSRDVAWIFVCQSGRLEREACVLAASMRRAFGADARLIAAIPLPESVMGTVAQSTIDFLDSIGVQMKTFLNPLVMRSTNSLDVHIDKDPTAILHQVKGENATPHQANLMMNKAFSLEVDCDSAINVFLDSDQVCVRPLDVNHLSVPMVGRNVFYPGASATAGVWQRAYEICEAEMPRQRLLVLSRDPTEPAIVSPPCFNSGIISVHRPWVHGLVEHYVECYKRLSEHNVLGKNRYFTEQTALAIAVMKSGVPYEIDNHRLNGSFFHYYSLPRLASFGDQAKLVAMLVHEFEGLRDVLVSDEDWQRVIAVT